MIVREPNTPKPEQVKILFTIDDDPDLKVKGESIWADVLENETYRVDNIPIFVYGVGYADVVAASMDQEREFLTFDRVVSRAPNITYRITRDPSVLPSDSRLREALLVVKPFATVVEHAMDGFYLYNVPESQNAEKLETILDSGRSGGLWDWEISSAPDWE
jgi:hypothetical protein